MPTATFDQLRKPEREAHGAVAVLKSAGEPASSSRRLDTNYLKITTFPMQTEMFMVRAVANAAALCLAKGGAMSDLSRIYEARFKATGLHKRDKVWNVLCSAYFQKLIPASSTVLDLGCGYGEFINNIRAAKKLAADLNPDAPSHLDDNVEFYKTPATDLNAIEPKSVDVVFTSNFLEHLRTKDECNSVFAQVRRVLRPGARFIVMGPNIRYCYAEYWDYYDHYLPLSHLSLAEGLSAAGFGIERVVPRFLPYTMNNSTPTHPFLVRVYLALPLAWPILGKQFLVVGRNPQ